MNASELFTYLWREKYAGLATEAQQAEATRRAEDFVDGPRPVGPWLLRPLTAYDLLVADGYECPLVAGEAAALQATPDQLWWFAWLLRADTDTGPFARWRFIRRMRRRHLSGPPSSGSPSSAFFADLAAMAEFVERHFADSAAPKKIDPKTGQPLPQRESGTNWLAGLVMALACETGWTEEHILQLPLGRLWQYLRILDRKNGAATLAATAANRLRADCLAEVNETLAAQRADSAP